MKVPKGLSNHPAVSFVETAETNGSDSKYIVHVKDGYVFTQGHAAGCSGSIGVDTVAEFLYAKPVYKRRNPQYNGFIDTEM